MDLNEFEMGLEKEKNYAGNEMNWNGENILLVKYCNILSVKSQS